MIGFQAFQCHQAMNLHFGKTDYDYFKYNGKTRANHESFSKSKFKWQFISLEKKKEHLLWFYYQCFKFHGFSYISPQMVFNVARRKDLYVHPDDMYDTITSDLTSLKRLYGSAPEQMFMTSGLYPDIYQQYKRGGLTLETLLLIDLNITHIFHDDVSDDIIAWPGIVTQMNSVKSFIDAFFDSRQFLDLFTAEILDDKQMGIGS